MAAPKGHLPYAGCEKGALFGYRGKPEDAYTDEQVRKIGEELVTWFTENPMEIWFEDFFTYRGIKKSIIDSFIRRYPVFHEYYATAKEIQEGRLHKYPFWKKADWNVARFVLTNSHDKYKNIEQDKSKQMTPEMAELLSDLTKIKEQRKDNA
jgi:hypothetical protein